VCCCTGLCVNDYQVPAQAIFAVIGGIGCGILTGHDTGCFSEVCKVAMSGEVAGGHYHQPPKPPWSMVKLEGLHIEGL